MAVKMTTPATATTAVLKWTAQLGTIPTAWFRVYAYFPALPASQHVLVRLDDASGNECSRVSISATGKVSISDAANANTVQTTTVIPTGAWFRVEGFVIGSATVGQVEVKLFLTADSLTPTETQTSPATYNTNTSISTIRFGAVALSIANASFYLDDAGVTDQGYLGPTFITSTGTIAVKKPSLSGTGADNILVNGSIAIKKPALSGTAIDNVSVNGSIAVKKPALSAASHVGVTANGSIAVKKPALSGSAADIVSVNGTIAVKKAALSGSVHTGPIASGSIIVKKAALSGTVHVGTASTGSIAVKKATLSGIAHAGPIASGTISIKKPGLSGISTARSATSVRVGGVWVPCVVKARIGGTWVSVIPKVKIAGNWVSIS
jgi:hypothetical protein